MSDINSACVYVNLIFDVIIIYWSTQIVLRNLTMKIVSKIIDAICYSQFTPHE